jgi:diaminopimelate decarboxylase
VETRSVEQVLTPVGGGLPCAYRDPVAGISVYGEAISHSVQSRLGSDYGGELLAEPGRFLVGDAGLIEADRRSSAADVDRGVHVVLLVGVVQRL